VYLDIKFYVICVNGGPIDYVDEWLHLGHVIDLFQVIGVSNQIYVEVVVF